MADVQHIWTREGKVALRPKPSTLGITREERLMSMIDEYASGRHEVRDVYVRAYRRAGLLPGDPDELLSASMPVEPAPNDQPHHDDSDRPAEDDSAAAADGIANPPEGFSGEPEDVE